jgi:cytochrome c-type biogenesis protein CcmH/NrfF
MIKNTQTEQTFATPTKLAEVINEGLMSQAFVDWYENAYTDFVTAEPTARTEAEILEDIIQIFNLKP